MICGLQSIYCHLWFAINICTLISGIMDTSLLLSKYLADSCLYFKKHSCSKATDKRRLPQHASCQKHKAVVAVKNKDNRILSKSKILLVLYSCELLTILYIIYQSTYCFEYFMQGNLKYPRIKKIHQMKR